jgi:diguanylate cyclase
MAGPRSAAVTRDSAAHPSGRRGPRLVDVSQAEAVNESQPMTLVIEPTRDHGLRFARRIHAPRTLGLALGFLCVFATLYEHGAPTWVMALLVLNGFVWPHVAYAIASHSRDPHRAEIRNLIADSAFGGGWIAAMQFNLLPSVLLFAMLAMDKMSVGGWRLFVRALSLQAVVCLAVAAAQGFAFEPMPTLTIVLACLPMLVAYPMAVGLVTYRLSRRVREQNRQLGTLSRTDGLTGLLNRVNWERMVSAEFKRHHRHGSPAALMMIDIDGFKAINDRYGHLSGDEVIRNVAVLLDGALREQDIPGRYGGDEFGVLLPDTDLAGALAIAERVRARIEAAVVESSDGVRCSISVGVAAVRGEGDAARDWIGRADRALYRAKVMGRNRIAAEPEADAA